jgi:hypothetical protein
MEESFKGRLFAGLLGALALAACTPDVAPRPAASAAPAVRSYSYDGVAGSSHVAQEKSDGGKESVRGTTELGSVVDGSAPRTLARESATLDAHGRLERAEIIVGRAGAAGTRYMLDPTRGRVLVERPGSAPLDWLVPADAPWMYSPGSEQGDLTVTPVSAWVALRAASAGSVVRVLEPEQRRSYLVMADQVAVATERGTTLALGSGSVDADERFITELRLSDGSVMLARVATVDLGA